MNNHKKLYRAVTGVTLLVIAAVVSGCASVPEQHQAASKGDVVGVERSLKSGVDVNAKSPTDGSTMLHMAVKSGQIEMVKYLLAHGADVNSQDERLQTPLHVATIDDIKDNDSGALEVLHILLAAGAKIDARNKWNNTPFHTAASYTNSVEVLRILMAAGGKIDSKGYQGATPFLAAAAHSKSIEVLRFLIEAGANPYEKGLDDRTALHFAAEHNMHPDTVRYLLALGIYDVNARTSAGGETPLMLLSYGVANDNTPIVEIAKLLLQAGANPNLKNSAGSTALAYARWIKNRQLANYLESYTASDNSGFQWGKLAAFAVGASASGVGNLDSTTQAQLYSGMVADSMPGQTGASNFQAAANQRLAELQSQQGSSSSASSAAPQKPVLQHQHLSYTCPSGAKLDTDVSYRTQACLNVKIEFAKVYACNDAGSFQRVQQNCQRVCGSSTCDER